MQPKSQTNSFARLGRRPRGGSADTRCRSRSCGPTCRNAARVGRYREAARLYHTEQVAYTCGTLLYRCSANLREDRPTNGGRRELDHRDPRTHRQSRQSAGRGLYPALNNQTLFRRDAYLCLYCGSRFPYSLLSRDQSRLSTAAARHLGNVVSACRRCNNAKASRSRSRRHAAAWRCRSPRPTPNTFSSRAGACSPTRWNT